MACIVVAYCIVGHYQSNQHVVILLSLRFIHEPRLCFRDLYLQNYKKCNKPQQSLTILAVFMLDVMWNVGVNVRKINQTCRR